MKSKQKSTHYYFIDKSKNSSLNGFTLIELLAVIVILAIIMLIAVPVVMNVIETARKNAFIDSALGIIRSAEQKVSIATIEDGTYSLPNVGEEIIIPVNELDYNNKASYQGQIRIANESGVYKYYISLKDKNYGVCEVESNNLKANIIVKASEVTEGCIVEIPENPSVGNADTSGANKPNLATKMIPIKWDGSKWVKANVNNETGTYQWYDYNTQMWANAVTVTDSTRQTYIDASVGTEVLEADILTYLVWIPRYKYKLFNVNNEGVTEQEIDIEFESETAKTGTGSTNGTYLTHPAFTFGTEPLTGFWVGKFETTGSISTSCTTEQCTTAQLTIKPNLTSVRSQTVSSMFYATRSMSTVSNNIYGFDSSEVNTHMMKNMEWGAVAYLSHSKYGQNTEITINNSSAYTTGCAGNSVSEASYSGCQNEYHTTQGVKASTTGNIYGVYDMSGGAWEYVMGNMENSTGAFYSSSAGFSTAPDSSYYDSYTYGTGYNDATAHARGLIGDATRETLKTFGGSTSGWYSDYSVFPNSTLSWFIRGGSFYDGANAGVFNFNTNNGSMRSGYSWRGVVHK